MSASRLIGILLVVAGMIALAYGGFSYTQRTDEAIVGPIHLSVQHRQTISVPVWAGIGVIVLGGLVIAFGNRKS